MNTKNIPFLLLAIIFAFLPFHAFLVTTVNAIFFDIATSPPLLLSAWKEILAGILIVFIGMQFLQKKIPFPKLDILDLFIILYVSWSLITGLVRWQDDIVRILWGARYSLSFLVFFLVLRHVPFSKSEKSGIFRLVVFTGAGVVLFGVFQKFLPQDFLTHFGYTPEFSVFDPGSPVSYCQKISFTDTCRLQSFLSGPNQFGAYLLLILPLTFFLTFHQYKRKKEIRKNASFRAFGMTLFCLGIFCLIFAYSRAAWGGMLVALALAFLFLFRHQKWFRYLLWSGGALGFLMIAALFIAVPRPYSETCGVFSNFEQIDEQQEHGLLTRAFCQVVYRASSSQGHFERSRDGLRHIIMHPLGTGLGDSGPASTRFYENRIGFIPESWYLQVGIDTGWPGLFLFFGIVFFLGKELLRKQTWRAQALFCSLIGISIMCLKLHSWESSVVSLLFWGACAVALSPERKKRGFKRLKYILWDRMFA